MKVLLVVRGGPPFLGPLDDVGKTATVSSSLFTIETAEDISFPAPRQDEEALSRYEACVLPASRFLELPPLSMPVPAIVYGASDMAWPCFEAGAFDFMREGWTMLELEARLHRLISPVVDCQDGFLALQGKTLVWQKRGLGTSPRGVLLTRGESDLLRSLLARRGTIRAVVGSRALSMQVSRLKTKLSALHEGLENNIEAVRGAGYLWISSPHSFQYGRRASSDAR